MKHYKIDQYFEFTFNTQAPTTGTATDADSVPTYRVYEENNNTAVDSGECAKRDDDNTTGYYYVRGQCTSAKGYEVGKTYEVRVAATVATVAGAAVVGRFGILPDVVWDALYGGTDNLDVTLANGAHGGAAATITLQTPVTANVTQVNGTSQTARDLGNALPAAAPGANGGLPTTNGTKLNQTADLTAGQSIAVSDKTGFALTSAYDAAKTAAQPGDKMDLVDSPNSTGIAAIVTAIWSALTSGMTTVGSIGKKLADWVVGTAQTGDAYAEVTHLAHGLSALATHLTDIKGSGWTTETLKAIKELVDDLEARLTAARAGYLDKLNVSGTLANTDNANSFKADVSGLALQSTLENATYGLAALKALIDDLPTSSELSTALASADDAVLAAIAALNNLSSAGAQAAAEAALAAYGAALQSAVDDLPTNDELATALAGIEIDVDESAIASAVVEAISEEGITVNVTALGWGDILKRFVSRDPDGNPLPGVIVRGCYASDGSQELGTQVSGPEGETYWKGNEGQDFYVWQYKVGYTFVNPEHEEFTA